MGFFDNCSPEDRFELVPSDASPPPGTSVWHILDWDQRRFFTVKIIGDHENAVDEDAETVDEDATGDVALEVLSRCIDDISSRHGSDVVVIEASIDGRIIGFDSNADHDETPVAVYPRLDEIPPQLRGAVKIVRPEELGEIGRLGRGVDRVGYYVQGRPTTYQEAVFKWAIHAADIRRQWNEMNCWMRIRHPHIVPFDRLVVEKTGPGEVVDRIVGFTSRFVAGGTFDDNMSREFKLKYLEDLLRVIDALNLEHGVVHRDVAPRNLLVDPATDSLQIFDFDQAAMLGRQDESTGFADSTTVTGREDVNGVICTLYQLVTRDMTSSSSDSQQMEVPWIQREKWIKHPSVRLDRDVSDFYRMLDHWVAWRNGLRNGASPEAPAPRHLAWPPTPPPEPDGTQPGGTEPKRDLARRGQTFPDFARPAHNRIPLGHSVKGNGELRSFGMIVSWDPDLMK